MQSIQAVCKNTFISFVTTDSNDSVSASMRTSVRLPTRSKSAESIRIREEATQFQALTQQSIERLNATLSVGLSSPRSVQTPAADLKVDAKIAKFTSGSRNDLLDLKLLQGKLAKALGHSEAQKKVLGKHIRVPSSCSVSTMAPDDVSECGSSFSAGLKRLPKAWSSGSVNSMISDWADCFDEKEDGEVEFELDIQEVYDPKMARQTSSSDNGSTSTRGSQGQQEMSHSQVPRNQNMEELYNSSDDLPPTTMMIRNMPGRYSQNDLMSDLEQLGLAGTYNFLYIPIDKRTAANVGYAFVNFVDASWARMCAERFEGYRFSHQKRSSQKLGTVSVAFLQGLEKNLQHYENTAVNMSRDKRRKPVVMANISQACR